MKLVLASVLLVSSAFATPLLDASKLKAQAMVDYINGAQKLWKADLPSQPWRASTLMKVEHTKLPKEVVYADAPAVFANIPESFDARDQWPNCPTIGLIRDQSDCGSCWAFGAVEAMSDRVCIASNGAQTPIISADDLLSCCGYSCGYGCEGGYPIRAWNYWVNKGIVTGSGFYEQDGCKPYEIEPCGTHTVNNVTHSHDCNGIADPPTPKCTAKCNNVNYKKDYKSDKIYGKSAYAVRFSVPTIQQEILTNGPVEAAYTVYEDFMNYKSGVYKHTTGGVLGGHAVRILGWGVEDGTDYWLVANSWNNDWGLKGFFKIVRGSNDCGIEEAIVAGLPKV